MDRSLDALDAVTGESAPEMDASEFCKAPARDTLRNARTMQDALETMGMTPDDNIDRRDQVIMYSAVKGEMERGIAEANESKLYDTAKDMRQRLLTVREGFGDLQTDNERRTREEQAQIFRASSKQLRERLAVEHRKMEHAVEEQCRSEQEKLAQLHQIQRENLELELSRMQKPSMKYSRRLLDLQQAESSLAQLHQYDEAKNVSRMIAQIAPMEEMRAEREFEQQQQRHRVALDRAQADDRQRLTEKLTAIRWNGRRQREREAKVLEQRIANNLLDMSHAHAMDAKKKPELAVHPSALLQRRPNYDSTAAQLRGSQFRLEVAHLADRQQQQDDLGSAAVSSVSGSDSGRGKQRKPAAPGGSSLAGSSLVGGGVSQARDSRGYGIHDVHAGKKVHVRSVVGVHEFDNTLSGTVRMTNGS